MPVLRQVHTTNYTVIPNELLRDQALSLKAVGLLCVMLSMPPDWKFTIASLTKSRLRDGRDSIHRAQQELVAAGYLVITREPGKNGRWGPSIWTVSDVPQPRSDFPDAEKQAVFLSTGLTK